MGNYFLDINFNNFLKFIHFGCTIFFIQGVPIVAAGDKAVGQAERCVRQHPGIPWRGVLGHSSRQVVSGSAMVILSV